MNILFCNSLFKYYLHGKCYFESEIIEKKGNKNSSSLVSVTVSFDSKPGVSWERGADSWVLTVEKFTTK